MSLQSNKNDTPNAYDSSNSLNHTIDDGAIDLISQSVSEMVLDTKDTKKIGQSNSNGQSDITLNSNDSLSMQSFDNARQRGVHSKSPPSPRNTVSTRGNSMSVDSSVVECSSQASFGAKQGYQRPSDIAHRQRIFKETTSSKANMFINKNSSSPDIDGSKRAKHGAPDAPSKISNIKHQSNTNTNDLGVHFGIGDSNKVNLHSNSNNSSVTLFGGISGSGHSFNVKNLHTNANKSQNINTKANTTSSDSFSIDYGSYSSTDSNEKNKPLLAATKSKIATKTGSGGAALSKISNSTTANRHSNDFSIYSDGSNNANRNAEYDDLSADLAALNNVPNTNVNENANLCSSESSGVFAKFWSSGSGQATTNESANKTNTDSTGSKNNSESINKQNANTSTVNKNKNKKTDTPSGDLISAPTSDDASYTVSELSSNQVSTDASSGNSETNAVQKKPKSIADNRESAAFGQKFRDADGNIKTKCDVNEICDAMKQCVQDEESSSSVIAEVVRDMQDDDDQIASEERRQEAEDSDYTPSSDTSGES